MTTEPGLLPITYDRAAEIADEVDIRGGTEGVCVYQLDGTGGYFYENPDDALPLSGVVVLTIGRNWTGDSVLDAFRAAAQDSQMRAGAGHMTTIVVGFTRSDRVNGYVSFCDGYRPGAEQDVYTMTVDGPDGLTGRQWAEAVWVASNSPTPQAGTGAERAAHLALAGLRRGGARLRSLSKGDTVTVDGIRYACASAGWEVIA